MSTVASDTRRPEAPPRVEPLATQAIEPVKVWAAAGGALLAVEVFFLAKWVGGSKFTPVDSGPDAPAGWMKAVLVGGQIVLVAATLFTLYWFLVRPWRRERTVTTDGLLCIAFLLAAPWDMLSNYAQNWFTYNSYLVNYGSVVGDLPGVLSRHAAGANEAFPLLVVPTAYVTVFIWLAILVCWIMRKVQSRWRFGPIRMIGVCLLLTMAADIVIEGLAFMPLGFWSYGGGHWAINGDSYFRYPIHEMIFGGAVFASFTCLRYFTNDKGQTIAERGIDRVNTTAGRKIALRGLGLIAAVHLGFLLSYHLPQGMFAIHSTEWPQDVQSRSYFTNRICGPEVDRACPGPATPNPKPGAGYLDYQRNFVPPGRDSPRGP